MVLLIFCGKKANLFCIAINLNNGEHCVLYIRYGLIWNYNRYTVHRCIVYRCTVHRCIVYRCTVYRYTVYRCTVYRYTVYRCIVYKCLYASVGIGGWGRWRGRGLWWRRGPWLWPQHWPIGVFLAAYAVQAITLWAHAI